MPGRLCQAANRAAALRKHRMDRLAELVANGASIARAGKRLGMTRGEAARAWANIKLELGPQAC